MPLKLLGPPVGTVHAEARRSDASPAGGAAQPGPMHVDTFSDAFTVRTAQGAAPRMRQLVHPVEVVGLSELGLHQGMPQNAGACAGGRMRVRCGLRVLLRQMVLPRSCTPCSVRESQAPLGTAP